MSKKNGLLGLTWVLALFSYTDCNAGPPIREPIIIDDTLSQFFVEDDFDGLFDDGVGSLQGQFSVVAGGYGNGAAYRGASEFDVSSAGSPKHWKRVTLTFITHSHMGNPILEVHGFVGNGSVTRQDVLVDYLLYTVPVNAEFNEWVYHAVDVTEIVKQTALLGPNVGFSYRVMDDLTGLFGGWRGLFVIAPYPECTGDSGCELGPQLHIEPKGYRPQK